MPHWSSCNSIHAGRHRQRHRLRRAGDQYFVTNTFHGFTAERGLCHSIKLAKPELQVIVMMGDAAAVSWDAPCQRGARNIGVTCWYSTT